MAVRTQPIAIPAPFAPASVTAAVALALTASAPPAARAQPAVQEVQVVGSPASVEDLTGFAAPSTRTPIDVGHVDASRLADIGAATLSDLTSVDASLIDSYNAVGYWTTFSIRGFQVDNRYNFRRDGLPINAETVLSLDNKSDVRILKGLSGIQAGTSAPGGLVDLVVKRPQGDLRTAWLSWTEPGTEGGGLDLSQRFGDAREFGARLVVAADRLDTFVRDTRGHRQSASLATDWHIDADRTFEFEFEHNLQTEASVPGFSMLGPVVPDPRTIDPRINLNDQPWSLPVVTQGNTMSVRYTQALAGSWRLKLQALQQQLVSNDHLAFPYGLYTDPDDCDPCDRYASDGRFSIWDFRSDDERRQTREADAQLSGRFDTGGAHHALTLEALVSRFVGRFNDEAYNLAGIGTIDGRTVVPAAPAADVPNDDRTERSTELGLRDTAQLDDDWTAWGGLRHTALHRASWPTASGDPTEATDYRQSFTTPWLAASRAFGPADMAYLSWGEGVESTVTPSLPFYDHAGRAQPATRSRQWEGGWKHAESGLAWSLVGYDVEQPQWSDVLQDPNLPPGPSNLFEHLLDGELHARGLEAEGQAHWGDWTLQASAMLQRIRHESAVYTQDGTVPPNVPRHALRLQADYRVAALPGLTLTTLLSHEGAREVLPDDTAAIPAWTRTDLGARYVQPLGTATLTWRAGVSNIFDRRAWREAPYQYGHAYLMPLAPRLWRASVEAAF